MTTESASRGILWAREDAPAPAGASAMREDDRRMSATSDASAATTTSADLPAALVAAEEALLATAGVEVERGEAPGPGGARLHYLTCGEGEPLLLLHGRGGAAAEFTPILAPLAAQRRVIALDLPGWGLSDKPAFTGRTARDALRVWMDGALALLDHLGLERAVVGGTSMGSAVALRFALRHPRLLQGLILMSPVQHSRWNTCGPVNWIMRLRKSG